MTNLQSLQPSLLNASIVASRHITLRCALKRYHQRVHQIVTSPGYDEEDIYLGEDHTADDSEETPNVFLGTLYSKKPDKIHSVTNYAKRIYAVVTLNDQFKMKLNVDTGADMCCEHR